MTLTPKKIRVYITQYGIISVLKVLESLEKMEYYEACQMIVDAIKEHNNAVPSSKPFPTKITPELLESELKLRSGDNNNLDLEGLDRFTNQYSNIIMDEIEPHLNLTLK